MTTANSNTQAKPRELVITRNFNAPRPLVWQAWTEPEMLTRWWGPQYFSAPVCKVDFREGGVYHFCMRSPDGQDFWSTGTYQEITPMDRIVYTDYFADAAGKIIPPSAYGMGDDFPAENVITLTFEDLGSTTRFTLRQAGIPAGEMGDMNIQGWNQSLDKLADSLAAGDSSVSKVTSKDGTPIAYDQVGQGAPLILVAGAVQFRAFDQGTQRLAALLGEHFTVINYDRRGRGESGDTQPFAVEREIEDIEALIDAVGGSALVYGISSGAALAMEAAIKLGSKVKKLAMYEAPYNSEASARQAWVKYRKELAELLAAGRRGDAMLLFMMLVGMPEEHTEGMRQSPEFPIFEAVAPTLAYDAAALGEEAAVPSEHAARVTMPALVMTGSETYPFMHAAADALTDAIPNAERRTLEGQTHEVAPEVLAPVLIEFFSA
ncbi:MAG: alpha/beta fold hydrolase [Chloroflexota bacterium]